MAIRRTPILLPNKWQSTIESSNGTCGSWKRPTREIVICALAHNLNPSWKLVRTNDAAAAAIDGKADARGAGNLAAAAKTEGKATVARRR